ncbi:hypothetical protein [Merismopedia glauca]|uniref:Uncharacterized protein n=1 Tax=Merismopedia glauca CCAP 1448/3 TaxID=1296344 RepID=A0A2T1BXZ4_9CYAN|nr:hypothetical protein [Merismopedia glauca]PSB00871.1 hypothetical protein C7B64_21260 [Merismopedia glauca CCAP 1448/3]
MHRDSPYKSYIQPKPEEATQSRWKYWQISLLLVVITVFFGSFYLMQLTAPKVTHIRADDNSSSAKRFQKQRLQHCQASVRHYQWGYREITINFADRAVVNRNVGISNPLSTLGQCRDTSDTISNKNPGTSLMLLLDEIKFVVQKERLTNPQNPVVITITIQDAEAGTNQPKLDFVRVKETVTNLIGERDAIAFMVEDETLKKRLEREFVSQQNVRVCPLKDVEQCVDWAFDTTI